MGLDISPEGRFLSYYKFRSDSRMFHLYDLETGAVRDLKFSIFRCCWVDEGRVAWSKSAGLKLLDVASGKSRTVLRGVKDILKRDSGWAESLGPFTQEEAWEELHLLGPRDGRLWFTLRLQVSGSPAGPGSRPPSHTGVWSVEPDGSRPKLQLLLPELPPNLNGPRLLPDGGVGGETCSARDQVTAHVWDGTDFQPFPGWRLVPSSPP